MEQSMPPVVLTRRARVVLEEVETQASTKPMCAPPAWLFFTSLISNRMSAAAAVAAKLGLKVEQSGETSTSPRGTEQYRAFKERILLLAGQEADSMRHQYVGTEHLLLAFFRDGSDTAVSLLMSARIALADVRRAVELLLYGECEGGASGLDPAISGEDLLHRLRQFALEHGLPPPPENVLEEEDKHTTGNQRARNS